MGDRCEHELGDGERALSSLVGEFNVVLWVVHQYLFLRISLDGLSLEFIMLRLVQLPSSVIVRGFSDSSGMCGSRNDGLCGQYFESGGRRICHLQRASKFGSSGSCGLYGGLDLPAFGAKISRRVRMAGTRR